MLSEDPRVELHAVGSWFSLPPFSQICCWYNLLNLLAFAQPAKEEDHLQGIHCTSLVWFDLLFTLIPPSFPLSSLPLLLSSPLFSLSLPLSFPP